MDATAAPRMDRRLAARLAEKKAALDRHRPLSPATLRLIHADLQVLLTFHSNAIEGNTLSLRETQLVIEHGVTIGGHALREHLEATNHAEAVRTLVDMVDREAPIDTETVLHLHRVVMDKLLDDAGQWRVGPVSIRGARLQPPPAAHVPTLMAEWAAWLDGAGRRYDPVMRAAIAHHGLVAVHPFRDGNGRVGRLLLNLLLMQDGYPPALVLREWRLGYLAALAQADTGRFTALINLIGRAVERGLDLYLDACATEVVADDALPLAELAVGSPYSAEYLALLIRKGRLAGSKRGHRWYSTQAALDRYRAEVAQGVVPKGRPPRRGG